MIDQYVLIYYIYHYWVNILYTSDPLWDGQDCGSLESPCCNVPGIPWFHRDILK